jgi:murein L,D-transpeptidase YcbB/YkuD
MIDHDRRRATLCVGVVLSLHCIALSAEAQDDAIGEVLRSRVEALRETGRLDVRGTRIASVIVLPDVYERRKFRPAWRDPRTVEQLVRAIADAAADGLDPRDYHQALLERLRGEVAASGQSDAVLLADYDLLLTDALVRLGYHLMFGKVDPERVDPNWNMAREIRGFEPASDIQRMLDAGDVYQALEREKPAHQVYVGLKRELARYRQVEAAGGWPLVPAGPALRVGAADARVPTLKRRLQATGDLVKGGPDTSTRYDSALAAAVRSFQVRMGDDDDGVLGEGTRSALNVPVGKRIQQIRLNLERGRWVLHHLDSTFVVVNIAGYSVAYVRDGRTVWRSRAVVGLPYRRTPVFRDSITYLVFNPTWTVPPGIMARDMLPRLKRGGVRALPEGMRVLNRSGRPVDASRINWSAYSASSFPFTLRQDPGPQNALGLVKFMFPNRYLVYLHDTPSRELFDESARAFSSGCIRVERPFELAELLLADASWNADSIARAVATRRTRTVHLRRPTPVLLLYWTAWVDDQGRVNFRPDVYQRDVRLARALDEPFRFRTRPVVTRPR